MTNREFVYGIRSAFKWLHSDVMISDRAILTHGRKVADKYIKQQVDKRKLWESPTIFTPLYIEMIQVPMVETCDYASDCMISRSKHKLPKIGEGMYGMITMGAYSVGMRVKFVESTPQRFINIQKMKITSPNIVYYWFFNNYLYASSPDIDVIILPAYIEGDVPPEFSMDCEQREEGCVDNPLDSEFKCPSFLLKDIIDGTSQYYLTTYKRSIGDSTTDALEEVK